MPLFDVSLLLIRVSWLFVSRLLPGFRAIFFPWLFAGCSPGILFILLSWCSLGRCTIFGGVVSWSSIISSLFRWYICFPYLFLQFGSYELGLVNLWELLGLLGVLRLLKCSYSDCPWSCYLGTWFIPEKKLALPSWWLSRPMRFSLHTASWLSEHPLPPCPWTPVSFCPTPHSKPCSCPLAPWWPYSSPAFPSENQWNTWPSPAQNPPPVY